MLIKPCACKRSFVGGFKYHYAASISFRLKPYPKNFQKQPVPHCCFWVFFLPLEISVFNIEVSFLCLSSKRIQSNSSFFPNLLCSLWFCAIPVDLELWTQMKREKKRKLTLHFFVENSIFALFIVFRWKSGKLRGVGKE